MTRTTKRNAVLIYLNLRKRKLAIVADEGMHQAVGQRFWEKLGRELRANLHSTYYENAVAITVREVGEALKKHFPREAP